MASRTVLLLTDDTDGSEADVIVKFGVDGTQYEIDLSHVNANKLHGALEPWIKTARKTGGSRGRRGASGKVDLKAVRDWAKQHGMKVSERGRVSAEVAGGLTEKAGRGLNPPVQPDRVAHTPGGAIGVDLLIPCIAGG